MVSQKKICFEFAKSGKCRFGKRCNFSHGDGKATTQPSNSTSSKQKVQEQRPLSDSETEYRSWVKEIPRRGYTNAVFRGSYAEFFAEARRLTQLDSAVMQDVVVKLASEEGLQIVNRLLQHFRLDSLPPTSKGVVLKREMLPFFQILADPIILNSLILEQQVGCLYSFVFGVNGARAVPTFDFVSSALVQLERSAGDLIDILEPTVVVFRNVFEYNTLASVQSGLAKSAKQIEEIFTRTTKTHSEFQLSNTALNLTRLFRHLEIASSVPQKFLEKQTSDKSSSKGVLVRPDPPGGENARHDNDFEDICQIKLLPTRGEIMSARSEYLPANDHSTWHVDGVKGLIDRNFRLLREDTVGQLRDAIQYMDVKKCNPGQNRKAAPRDVIRTNVYPGVRLDRIAVNRTAGFNVEVLVQQPMATKNLSAKDKTDWWSRSKRLQGDALVCLVSDGSSPIYCTVSQSPVAGMEASQKANIKQGSEATSKKVGKTVSAILSLVEQENVDHINYLIQMFAGPSVDTLSLVEFPGVLLPAFGPTLQALQKIYKTGSLPLAQFFAPSQSHGMVDVPIPAYARTDGFSFDLSSVVNDNAALELFPGRAFDTQRLLHRSSLDEPQAQALVNSLTHCIGLIQGPPGTGKSYTGVAALKVLLASKKTNRRAKIGPILCICYTNHALDQLLEDILDSKVTQKIIRIGSQSKSERLKRYNLIEAAKAEGKTRHEKRTLWETHSRFEAFENDFVTASKILRQQSNTQRLIKYLQLRHPRYYEELFGRDEDGFEKAVNRHPERLFANWLKNGIEVTGFQKSDPKSLIGLNKKERYSKYYGWFNRMQDEIKQELLKIVEDSRAELLSQQVVHSECHLRCLRDADIIGVTTSGLARKIDVLRRVECKIMLCEEAGEVLEPHLLAAMLPNLEHVILIGDHEQLRPQVQNFLELSREGPRGETHCLDISLFERLVRPIVDSAVQLPFSTLQIQRRMHPSISELIRNTIYPNLLDHESVKDYPSVSGMRKRLFWFDHSQYESSAEDDATATSHWNEFEVDMTIAVVTHLMHQGVYKGGEIAVITPYLGQLHRLRHRLQSSFVITLDERDEDQLAQAGMLANETEPKSAATKSTMLQALRVATIDNFQGEEAKVIVISLVRSNPRHRCGFLKTSNRINVLLSRAKHGMYIIGNSATSGGVKMWSDVIDMLRRNDNIGPELELYCERHPETRLAVSNPNDFSVISPEGGCNEPCIQRLSCGHACKKRCHSALLHGSVHCLEPCQRPQQGCEHPCPKACGDPCPPKCLVRVKDPQRRLNCGHEAFDLACWQAQDLSQVNCTVTVQKEVPGCLHVVQLPCYVDVNKPEYSCMAFCSADLPCGHQCHKQCSRCRADDGNGNQFGHGACVQACGRMYNTCAHRCRTPCHGDAPCPACSAPCDVRCGHSRCVKQCSEPCIPCAEELCHSTCPHSTCSLPCAAPCNHVPCSLRCPRLLDCGHLCPSTCGETCPKQNFCQICADDNIKASVVDVLEGKQYHEIDLDAMPCIFPSCGHILTIESMDGIMEMNKHYELEEKGEITVPTAIKSMSHPFMIEDAKLCPMCRGSLRDVGRYGRLVRRAILDESTKKLIVQSNRQYVELSFALQECLTHVKAVEDKLPTQRIQEAQLSGEGRGQHVHALGFSIGGYDWKAWQLAKKLRGQIAQYRNTAKTSEQPFSKVRNAVNAVRQRTGKDISFQLDGDVLQNKGFVLASSLLVRLDLALLTTFLSLKQPPGTMTSNMSINWKVWDADFEEFRVLAQDSQRVTQQVEAYIYLAQLRAIQRSKTPEPTGAEVLRQAGVDYATRGLELCDQNPRQTRGLDDELRAIQKMLRGSTFYSPVSSDERQAVIRAMATEMLGTGHWYYCENGHPFTIGECGMPMERATCPDCSAPVGGQNHVNVAGVRHATDLEAGIGALRM